VRGADAVAAGDEGEGDGNGFRGEEALGRVHCGGGGREAGLRSACGRDQGRAELGCMLRKCFQACVGRGIVGKIGSKLEVAKMG
jgi:hypothetical protein